MSIRTRLGVSLILLLVSALPAWAQTGTTAFYVDSQPGDWVGGGVEQTWTDAQLFFSAQASPDRSLVTIAARFPNLDWWIMQFSGPEGAPLTPGVYENATRHPFQEKHLNGLNVMAPNRGCNELVGQFVIHEIVIDASGAVERFAADFEQHCEWAVPGLFGAVRYHSTRASLVPFDGAYPTGAYPFYSLQVDGAVNGYVTGPGIDCGAGRPDCDETFGTPTTVALTAIPNPGYVFLGWAGFDCVGVATASVDVNRARRCRPVFNAAPGEPGVEAPNYAADAAFLDGPFGRRGVTPAEGRSQFVFVPPFSRLAIESATSNSVSLQINHPLVWYAAVRFSAAVGQVLAPGLYEPTAAWVSSGSDPRVQLTYQDTVCTAPGGRFRIYEIAFEGPTLSAFSADFEVPCENGRIFTGSIRYNAVRASLLPFDGVYGVSRVTVTPTIGGYVTSALGIDCGDGGRTDCEESFGLQSIVSLQATGSPGYQFLGWGGICTGVAPIFTMTGNISGRCLAVFHPTADALSHPFGNQFLMIEYSGATPSRSLWLPPESTLQVSGDGSLGHPLTFTTTTRLGNRGAVGFRIATGRIVPGEYQVPDASGAMLDVIGCYTSRGFFKVYEAEYNLDGSLASFAADFEVYCGVGFSWPYAVGAVRYRASRNVVIPFFDGAAPVNRLAVTRSPYGQVIASGITCGPIADDCVEDYGTALLHSIHAIPSAGYAFVGWLGDCSGGSFTQRLIDRPTWCEPIFRATRTGLPEDPRLAAASITIQSPPGEPIGGGIIRTYLSSPNFWAAGTSDSGRTLSLTTFGEWDFQFRTTATGVLAVGNYDGAVGMFGSTASPGLSVRGPGGFCSSAATTGRYVIYELRLGAPSSSMPVEALALDFEQRCGNGPALRGSIRYRSSRSVLQPFADESHPFTRFDFTGDQNPDLVFQNRSDGRLLLWHLSGVAYRFNEPPSIPQISDINWHIVGHADANSDGYNDLYWQHQTTGALAIWYMRDTQVVSTKAVTPAVSDIDWQMRTIFDVDRDGQPDVIWQHRVSGHIAVWYMNAGTFRSAQLIGPGQIADPNWTIVGAGDADGDGSVDLYWQHPTTGQLALWYMDGVRMLRSELLTPSRVADTNWQMRGIADLNRDGSPDVVWQNVSTSSVAVWMMAGSRLVESRLIAGPAMPGAEWVLVGPR